MFFLLISTHRSVRSVSCSALPSSAMALCWTNTSASAGQDSTIPAEWPSMATKVGCWSLCVRRTLFAASFRIKTVHLWREGSFSFLTATHCLKVFEGVSWGARGYETSVKGLWVLFLCVDGSAVSLVSSSRSHRWPVGSWSGCFDTSRWSELKQRFNQAACTHIYFSSFQYCTQVIGLHEMCKEYKKISKHATTIFGPLMKFRHNLLLLPPCWCLWFERLRSDTLTENAAVSSGRELGSDERDNEPVLVVLIPDSNNTAPQGGW